MYAAAAAGIRKLRLDRLNVRHRLTLYAVGLGKYGTRLRRQLALVRPRRNDIQH